MAKCDCYHQHGMKFLCYGTKEMEECTCGGDTSRCDFYPEKRKAKMKLKSCPLCRGNRVGIHHLSDGSWVVAHHCTFDEPNLTGSIRTYGSTKEEAVDRWNTRAEEQ